MTGEYWDQNRARREARRNPAAWTRERRMGEGRATFRTLVMGLPLCWFVMAGVAIAILALRQSTDRWVAPVLAMVIGLGLWACLSIMRMIWLDSRWEYVPRRQHCMQCGYDLRGLTSARCPECGGIIGAAQAEARAAPVPDDPGVRATQVSPPVNPIVGQFWEQRRARREARRSPGAWTRRALFDPLNAAILVATRGLLPGLFLLALAGLAGVLAKLLVADPAWHALANGVALFWAAAIYLHVLRELYLDARWEYLPLARTCRTCGYDLRGGDSPRCPECGHGLIAGPDAA